MNCNYYNMLATLHRERYSQTWQADKLLYCTVFLANIVHSMSTNWIKIKSQTGMIINIRTLWQ